MVGLAHPNTNETQELIEVPASIAVVGVGGGGCNAVQRIMREKTVPGVTYISVNTDIRSLQKAVGGKVIQIGAAMTRGNGAGGLPEVGAKAAESDADALRAALGSADLVFITAGMGGGTGTGAAPFVAKIARESGALVVGIVSTPFSWEGQRRLDTALAGVSSIRQYVDNVVVIHNDRLVHMLKKNVSMNEALQRADEAIMYGVLSVAELVNVPGDINVDLADVRTIMSQPGQAIMAIGETSGANAALEAAHMAVANPLLDMTIDGANGVLFCVNGGPSLTLGDVNAAGEYISSRIDRRAIVFFGMVNNDKMADRVRLTLIATGIPEKHP